MFQLFIAAFIFTWLSSLAWVVFFQRFNKKLSAQYEDVLPDIGELPSPFKRYHSVTEIKSTFKFVVFIFKRHYLELENPELKRLAATGRRILLCNITGLLLLCVLIPAMLLSDPQRSTNVSSTRADTGNASEHEGISEYKAGRYEQALALLSKALETQAANPDLLYYRALSHEKLLHTALALQDFSSVTQLLPSHFDSYRHIDYLLALEQRWPEIVERWSAYIELRPDDAAAYLERGGAWLRMGELTNAAQDALISCDLGNAEGCIRHKQLAGD